MRNRLFLAFLSLIPLMAIAGEPQFFSELSDIPLMPGLYELADETVVFDKPEGRIVETAAVSETENINKIKEFYDSTLPQLGWERLGSSDYIRQEEVLHMQTETRQGLNVVKLMVSPR